MNASDRSTNKEPGLWEILLTIREKELYLNVPIHIFILIPAATLLAFLGKRVDRIFGWQPYIGTPLNYYLAAVLFITGISIVWYSYGYLCIKGKGSPGSHISGGTTELVTTGIYAWVRHPSVVGKLTGVIGLGVLFRSPAFTFIIIPILLVYSLLTNRYIQERYCEEKFQDAYRAYRKETPMIIPKLSKIRTLLQCSRSQ